MCGGARGSRGYVFNGCKNFIEQMNLEFETQDLFVDYLTPDRVENNSITGVKDLERLLEDNWQPNFKISKSISLSG